MTPLSPTSDNLGILSAHARRQIVGFALLMCAFNLLLPLGQYAWSHMIGQAFWRQYQGNYGPSEWFSSVQLLLIAIVAWGNYRLGGLEFRRCKANAGRSYRFWVVFALGFLLFAVDERVGIHSALRDGLFRPAGLFVDLDWLRAGDVGLYLFFLVGVVFTPFLYPELRRHLASLVCYSAAMLLALSTIVVDSLRKGAMSDWPYRRFWDYPFEEVGEIWAQLLFLISFLIVLHSRLGRLAAREVPLAEKGQRTR